MLISLFCGCSDFYPRSPCGERQKIAHLCLTPLIISIHALLAESDYTDTALIVLTRISIHALLAESDLTDGSTTINLFISIHALLAESDFHAVHLFSFCGGISIHALLAESDR